jgi:hypothetical protein
VVGEAHQKGDFQRQEMSFSCGFPANDDPCTALRATLRGDGRFNRAGVSRAGQGTLLEGQVDPISRGDRVLVLLQQ